MQKKTIFNPKRFGYSQKKMYLCTRLLFGDFRQNNSYY